MLIYSPHFFFISSCRLSFYYLLAFVPSRHDQLGIAGMRTRLLILQRPRIVCLIRKARRRLRVRSSRYIYAWSRQESARGEYQIVNRREERKRERGMDCRFFG